MESKTSIPGINLQVGHILSKSERNIFHYKLPFPLENGSELSEFQLTYHTFGQLNKERNNVIWIVHALTGNSDPSEWWPEIVGYGKVIDPANYFIVCANCLGSAYGSTGPLSVQPETGLPYYHDFPLLTNRDIALSFDKLREDLGIQQIQLLIGASLGGQQALEWSIIRPQIFCNLVLIATNARHSPWGIAFNESQRMAIYVDPTFTERHPDAGKNGMKVARSIALLSYRTSYGYNMAQKDDDEKLDNFKVISYQRYQGEKLAGRFNAFSYITLSKAMDSHNVGRSRGNIVNALSQVKAKTTVLGISTDLLFPLEEQQELQKYIPGSNLEVIHSPFGHDGFLTDHLQVSEILARVLNTSEF